MKTMHLNGNEYLVAENELLIDAASRILFDQLRKLPYYNGDEPFDWWGENMLVDAKDTFQKYRCDSNKKFGWLETFVKEWSQNMPTPVDVAKAVTI